MGVPVISILEGKRVLGHCAKKKSDGGVHSLNWNTRNRGDFEKGKRWGRGGGHDAVRPPSSTRKKGENLSPRMGKFLSAPKREGGGEGVNYFQELRGKKRCRSCLGVGGREPGIYTGV